MGIDETSGFFYREQIGEGQDMVKPEGDCVG